MEIEFKYGGISYNVVVDVEDEYVCGVLGVEVWTGEEYIGLEMTDQRLEDFFDAYEDSLNQAYMDSKIAFAESCAEEKWERHNDR